MSEICPSYDRIASPENSRRFPLEFDDDHNGCINPLEGAKIPPNALLDLLSQSVSDSLVTEDAARAFINQLKTTSLPAYFRLYAHNERRGVQTGKKLNLFPSDLPSLAFPNRETAPAFCDAQIMVPRRDPMETVSMSTREIYRRIVRESAKDPLTRMVSQYSLLTPRSRHLIILYAEAHEPAERVHQSAVVLTKLIRTYGIGHIAVEYPDEMAPRGCLPEIIANEDNDTPSINSLLQLMFPELNYFGVEDGELMRGLAMQAMLQIMGRRVEVELRTQGGEIDESRAKEEDGNLVLEGASFMAVEGEGKRDRAMAKNLLRALEATKAQVILYPVGANHAPRIFRWLERSSTASVLTLAPQDLIYTKGEASFKQD